MRSVIRRKGGPTQYWTVRLWPVSVFWKKMWIHLRANFRVLIKCNKWEIPSIQGFFYVNLVNFRRILSHDVSFLYTFFVCLFNGVRIFVLVKKMIFLNTTCHTSPFLCQKCIKNYKLSYRSSVCTLRRT